MAEKSFNKKARAERARGSESLWETNVALRQSRQLDAAGELLWSVQQIKRREIVDPVDVIPTAITRKDCGKRFRIGTHRGLAHLHIADLAGCAMNEATFKVRDVVVISYSKVVFGVNSLTHGTIF